MTQRMADRATPRPTASHRLWTAWWAARPCSPAPIRRATAEVVPYARKMNTAKPVASTALAMAMPASSSVPR